MKKKYIITYKMKPGRGCGAVGKSVLPANERLCVRIPVATDLSRQNR